MILQQLHRARFILAATVALGALSAGACGGGGSSDNAPTAAPRSSSPAGQTGATTAATASGGAASTTLGAKFSGPVPAGALVVDQKDQLFKPDKLTAKVGDTVYFTNSEAALHSVNVDGKNILGQGVNMKQGEISTLKLAKAGTYAIT